MENGPGEVIGEREDQMWWRSEGERGTMGGRAVPGRMQTEEARGGEIDQVGGEGGRRRGRKLDVWEG